MERVKLLFLSRQSTQTETDDETEEFETPAKKQKADDQCMIPSFLFVIFYEYAI